MKSIAKSQQHTRINESAPKHMKNANVFVNVDLTLIDCNEHDPRNVIARRFTGLIPVACGVTYSKQVKFKQTTFPSGWTRAQSASHRPLDDWSLPHQGFDGEP